MFSAYERSPDGVWVGTHRLPLSAAIRYLKSFHERHRHPVAIVPDGEDPGPYFDFVEKLNTVCHATLIPPARRDIWVPDLFTRKP